MDFGIKESNRLVEFNYHRVLVFKYGELRFTCKRTMQTT